MTTQREVIPGPIGKYSSVKEVDIGPARFLFVSGMACVDQAPFDVAQQTEIIFRRMAQLLADHGATFEHLTKITAFLADIRGEYDAYNAVRNKTFAHLAAPPASSAVGVTLNLSGKLRVEIEAIALVPKETTKK